MEKNLPLELDREILIKLAPEQLVGIIVEQAIATIKLNSRILELEQKITALVSL
jgi:transposase